MPSLPDLLPPALLRLAGRVQGRVPVLRPLFQAVAGRVASREGIIRHGPAAGLRFLAGVSIAGYRLGTTEPDFQAAFAERIRPGDVVYDLGANVGFYTVLAARLVGPAGRVVAFEPFAESAARARANAARNGFGHVEVVEAAVSDAPGTAFLTLSTSPVTHHLDGAGAYQRPPGAPGVEVAVTSIDAFVASGGPPPDVVKVDVEGAEVAALHGMAATLRDHRPTLLVEVHDAVSDFPAALDALVVPLGYRVRVLGGGPVPAGGARGHVLLDPPDRL